MASYKSNITSKDSAPAIKVVNLYKTFKVPHEKHSSLKSAFLNMFRKKRYEEFKALDDINLDIKRGEFFGIIGRNGSGKSTLLKMLAGIYVPDSGEIVINGKISPFLELGVGFNPELSGRDNLYLGGAILGITRKIIDEKFDKIVEFAELEEFIDMKLKNYSSGMQVRLAFSLAINAHAEILLMDEVLAVGDTNFQAKCISEFKKYKLQGKTVVLVTHDLETVQRYCDRALLLRDGKIIKIDKSTVVAKEYIYNNMEDEETFDRKVGDISDKGENKENTNIKIKNIGTFDLKGKAVSSINTHDGLEIRISFEMSKKYQDNINVGISIENEEGKYLFGYSTEWDNYIPDKNKGTISMIIPEVPLLKDKYYINVTFINLDNGITLEYQPRVKSFKVFSEGSEYRYKGAVTINHKWGQQN